MSELSYYEQYRIWLAQKEEAMRNYESAGTTAFEILTNLKALGLSVVSDGSSISIPSFLSSLAGAAPAFDFSKYNSVVDFDTLQNFIEFCGKQSHDKCRNWCYYYGYLIYNSIQLKQGNNQVSSKVLKMNRVQMKGTDDLVNILYYASQNNIPIILNVAGSNAAATNKKNEMPNLEFYDDDSKRHYVCVPPIDLGDKTVDQVKLSDFFIMDPATPELKPLSTPYPNGLEDKTYSRSPLNTQYDVNKGNSYIKSNEIASFEVYTVSTAEDMARFEASPSFSNRSYKIGGSETVAAPGSYSKSVVEYKYNKSYPQQWQSTEQDFYTGWNKKYKSIKENPTFSYDDLDQLVLDEQNQSRTGPPDNSEVYTVSIDIGENMT